LRTQRGYNQSTCEIDNQLPAGPFGIFVFELFMPKSKLGAPIKKIIFAKGKLF